MSEDQPPWLGTRDRDESICHALPMRDDTGRSRCMRLYGERSQAELDRWLAYVRKQPHVTWIGEWEIRYGPQPSIMDIVNEQLSKDDG